MYSTAAGQTVNSSVELSPETVMAALLPFVYTFNVTLSSLAIG